jgi:hypothetical protein
MSQPTSISFRALCAELVNELYDYIVANEQYNDALVNRTRAELVKPEPQGLELVYRYCPVTIAECGGPCEQGPEYCDCGEIKGEPPPRPEPQGLPPRVGHILRLAEIIREVDGNHDKGAGALAEAILSHPGSRWRTRAELAQPYSDPTEERRLGYLKGLEDSAHAALAKPEPVAAVQWSEGICGNGAAILRDGVMVPIEEVVASLNRAEQRTAQPDPKGGGSIHGLEGEIVATIKAYASVEPQVGASRILHESDFGVVARAVLARFGRPAIKPVPPEPGTADHVTDDESTRWDRTTDAALWAKAFCLICPEMASREDVMIGSFMAGCDHQAWKIDAKRKPVPVAERLPGPEDCDVEGRCWWFMSAHSVGIFRQSSSWCLGKRVAEDFGIWTHWLPHYALPVPGAEVES